MNDSKSSPLVPVLILAAAAGAAFVTQAFAQTKPGLGETSPIDRVEDEPREDGKPQRPNPNDPNDGDNGRPDRAPKEVPGPVSPADSSGTEDYSEFREGVAEFWSEMAEYTEEDGGLYTEASKRERERRATEAEKKADAAELN